jgi:hypothetical protein
MNQHFLYKPFFLEKAINEKTTDKMRTLNP